jgi:hypothetical protein
MYVNFQHTYAGRRRRLCSALASRAILMITILARKNIFAVRIRRLPIFKWLMTMLRATVGRSLEWDVVRTALELEFPPDEAERQGANARYLIG